MVFRTIIVLLAVALVVGYVYIGGWRTVATGWLIAKVAPYERVVPDAETILVVGDSTAYGTGADDSSESIAGRIAAAYPDYSVRTRAKNGLTAAGLEAQLDNWLPTAAEQYSLIVLQIGANDVLQDVPPAATAAAMEVVLDRVSERAGTVLWLSSGNVGGARAYTGVQAQELEDRSRAFRDLAQELIVERSTVTYVDLFQEPSEDVFVSDPDTYLALDGIHPSSAGYAEWFTVLKPHLTAALQPE